jgi:hypothetical protein
MPISATSFVHRGKILELNDGDQNIYFELDPDQFIKDLKQLDPHNWDPLPINIMYVHGLMFRLGQDLA